MGGPSHTWKWQKMLTNSCCTWLQETFLYILIAYMWVPKFRLTDQAGASVLKLSRRSCGFILKYSFENDHITWEPSSSWRSVTGYMNFLSLKHKAAVTPRHICPISTKLHRHGESPALNRLICSLYAILRAPPTGNRKYSDGYNHNLIETNLSQQSANMTNSQI